MVASALGVMLGAAVTVHAADNTPIGRKLLVKSGKSLKLQSKDGAAIPAPSADPTSVGGTLIVTLSGGSGDQTESFDLPAGEWKASGNPVKAYSFSSPKGPGIVNRLRLQPGKQVKATGLPALLNLSQAPQLTAQAILIIGGDRYCLDFGTVPNPNTATLVKWGEQPSAGTCPAPPPTTTTTTSTTTTTIPILCGNGVVQAGEACDDGNAIACDGCTSCQIDACGDGNLCTDLGEQCDDGNTTSGDGCSSICESESTSCTNAPSGTRLVVVNLNVPPLTPLAGVQVTVDYPQFQTSIPGTGTSSLVQERTFVFAQPTTGVLTTLTSDTDQDISTVAYAPGPPGTEFIATGPFVAYSFDNCTPVSQGVCNRAQTVVNCCNNTGDPNQFNNPNFCNGTTPTVACPSGFDTECPARANTSCTGAGTPYACCTGAGTGSCDSTLCTAPGVPSACCTGLGTGNCEAIQLGCTSNSQPFPCCTGAGTGSCAVPTKGSCNVKCPGNPPVCAVNFAVTPNVLNFSTTTVSPCQGKVCSNNTGRACNVDADCVSPGTCTGTQQAGACPGDNECKTQQSLTGCTVRDPVNALGQAVDGVTCSVTIL